MIERARYMRGGFYSLCRIGMHALSREKSNYETSETKLDFISLLIHTMVHDQARKTIEFE